MLQRAEGSVPPPAVLLGGTYGVGKSAVLEHMGDLLAAEGTPFALMDVEARAMAAVWDEYLMAGPRQLVISGVVAERADLDF